MNRKILCMLIAAAMLTAAACSEKNESGASSAVNEKTGVQSDMVYFSNTGSVYNGGFIYKFGIDSPTYFLDLNTQEKSALCAVPNCTHRISSCLAQQAGDKPVFYKDCVYYFVSSFGYEEVPEGHRFYMKSTLYKAKLDSSEAEKVIEITDCVPTEGGGIVLDGNTIWFIGDDKSPIPENVYDDTWISESATPGSHFVCSINLDTEEYKNFGSITDEDKQYPCRSQCNNANIRGIYKDKLVIDYQYAFKDMENAVMGDYKPTDYVKFLSFEFDTKTETLTQNERPAPIAADENVYIGYDFAENTMTVIADSGERNYNYDELSASVAACNGKFFGLTKWIDTADFSEHTYPESIDEWVNVAYHNGSYYFLTTKGKTIEISEEMMKSE